MPGSYEGYTSAQLDTEETRLDTAISAAVKGSYSIAGRSYSPADFSGLLDELKAVRAEKGRRREYSDGFVRGVVSFGDA